MYQNHEQIQCPFCDLHSLTMEDHIASVGTRMHHGQAVSKSEMDVAFEYKAFLTNLLDDEEHRLEDQQRHLDEHLNLIQATKRHEQEEVKFYAWKLSGEYAGGVSPIGKLGLSQEVDARDDSEAKADDMTTRSDHTSQRVGVGGTGTMVPRGEWKTPTPTTPPPRGTRSTEFTLPPLRKRRRSGFRQVEFACRDDAYRTPVLNGRHTKLWKRCPAISIPSFGSP